MSGERLRPVLPAGTFTAEDLDRLPGLPSHVQLIDGRLVAPAPQSNFHSVTTSLLTETLRRHAPAGVRVRSRMTVTLARRHRPEADVLLVRAESVTGLDQNDFRPADVLLAVEVVSPDSAVLDRGRKPQLYAAGGIPHFWRVEDSKGRPTVYVHELDPATRTYGLSGIHHDRLKLTVPFDLDLDLTAIDDI